MKYCSNCGALIEVGAVFCGNCGQRVQPPAYNPGASGSGSSSSSSWSSGASGSSGGSGSNGNANTGANADSGGGLVGSINDYIGNTNKVKLNWKYLFEGVFKKHTTEEAEDIFICGTSRTTPPLSEVVDTWPKPWLYSRVFLCFVITFILLNICSSFFNNPNAYPGLIIVGAFAVPFTTLVMFLELNAFRNISLYDVLKLFMIGGCASLVVTLFLFDLELVSTDLSSTWGALMVGTIEEVGKLIIVYLLLKKIPSCNYILSALLAGACVGAGFAAFESAGYAMQPMLVIANQAGAYGVDIPVSAMMDMVTSSIYLRGILAPGGHVAWAAISGAALIIAKGNAPLTSSVFSSFRFWKIFAIPVVLHALWDAPLMEGYIKLTGLILLVWIVVLIFINMGLDEVKKLKTSYNENL